MSCCYWRHWPPTPSILEWNATCLQLIFNRYTHHISLFIHLSSLQPPTTTKPTVTPPPTPTSTTQVSILLSIRMIGKSGEATRSQLTVILTTSLSSFISLQPPTTAKPTGTPPPTPNVPTQVSILYFLYVLLLLKTLAADTEHLGMECYLLAAHF